MNELQNKRRNAKHARDIRDDFKARAAAATAAKEIKQDFENVGDNNAAAVGNTENIASESDDDDENSIDLSDTDVDSAEIVDRAPSMKRKFYQVDSPLSQRKFAGIPRISAQRRLKLLNYSGVKKVPSNILKLKNQFRKMKSQKKPVFIEAVPAIDNPFLTPSHILHRKLVPAKPMTPAEIVKSMRRKSKTGGNIEADFIPLNENVVHEYYDDPNELCDRLRLLISSRAAGNSNHSQEINSIISELRESGYVE